MILLSNLQIFLDKYLYFQKEIDVKTIEQHMANGLVVRGIEEIKKIGFGVSASLELFKKAKEARCDAIIVHHSFNLPSVNRYDLIFQNRIGFLIENNISLFGYHFLLDSHPKIGHNVQILEMIGAKPVKPYFHQGDPWGWIGELEKDSSFFSIMEKIEPYLSQRKVIYPFGPKLIRQVVAVSGKGAPIPSDMQNLIENKIDLYITGEVHEWNRELFREAKINFIAGGHYATEVFGMKALMEKIKNQFPEVEIEWLEIFNDI